MGRFDFIDLYEVMDNLINGENSYYGIQLTDTLLYEFIEEKTNKFESYKFNLLIIELRNYIYKMDFHSLNEIEKITEPDKLELLADIKFENNWNFRERIDYLLNIGIGISVNRSYNRFLEFTDIAEDLFCTVKFGKNEANNDIPLISKSQVNIIHKNNRHIKFRTSYNEECLTRIMKLLLKKGFLKNTDVDDWLYWFNMKSLDSPLTLIWENTPTMLSNVIQQICFTCSPTAVISAFGIIPVKPTKPKYIHTATFKEIEQIIVISQK